MDTIADPPRPRIVLQNQGQPPRCRSWLRTLKLDWNPRPLEEPRPLAPEFPDLPALERTVEVIRFSAQRAERWLSPGGGLREWVRWNVRLGCLIAMPTLVLVPLLTLLLAQITTWTALLVQIATNLALALGAMVLAAALAGVLLAALGRMRGR